MRYDPKDTWIVAKNERRAALKRLWQRLVKLTLWTVGTLYIFIEKFRDYPQIERGKVLSLKIDKDIQKMTRRELCDYMDDGLPKKGFWHLNSTTKIRLGAQLMRNLNLIN